VIFGLLRKKGVGLIVRQFVSKISNLRGSDPPTSQIGGQTDRQTEDGRHAIAIPCFALYNAVKS